MDQVNDRRLHHGSSQTEEFLDLTHVADTHGSGAQHELAHRRDRFTFEYYHAKRQSINWERDFPITHDLVSRLLVCEEMSYFLGRHRSTSLRTQSPGCSSMYRCIGANGLSPLADLINE